MLKIDANIILRYILEDHAERSPLAKKIITENIVETPIEVLCEVVYVLARTYRINRKEIADTLLEFFQSVNTVLPHREAVIKGIEYFGTNSLDFVDCVLAGYAKAEKDDIYTFDNRLEKFIVKIKEGITITE
jgi:predicted nucleic acid-binding protein